MDDKMLLQPRVRMRSLQLVATVHAGATSVHQCIGSVRRRGMRVMRNAIKGLTFSLWSRAVSAGMSDVTFPPVRCN